MFIVWHVLRRAAARHIEPSSRQAYFFSPRKRASRAKFPFSIVHISHKIKSIKICRYAAYIVTYTHTAHTRSHNAADEHNNERMSLTIANENENEKKLKKLKMEKSHARIAMSQPTQSSTYPPQYPPMPPLVY